MADFSHLQKLHVSEETLAEFTFGDVPGEPSIWFAPATDANKAWHSERLRVSIERAEAAEKAPKVPGEKRRAILTLDDIEADRELDKVLLARTCAKRWGTVPLDAKGAPVEFSEANVLDFFHALPNFMFDPARGFTGNPYNFIPRVVTQEQADTAGNG